MAYENARTFLYRILPWAPLGDPNAYVNIHWSRLGAGYTKPAFYGRACLSLDECVRAITFAAKSNETQGIYACVSTQARCEVKQFRNGNGTYKNAMRDQSSVVQLRSLFIDIDVRETKGYKSHRDALAALMQFIADAGLPRFTLVVNSGGGIQPYWCIGEALDLQTWQPLANALANAVRRFGLKCDAGCSVDSARLMRMPDTTNIKPGRDPLQASLATGIMLPYDYSLQQMQAALAPYMGAQVLTFTPRGKSEDGLNDELSGGIEAPKAAPVALETVAAAGCGFIAEALATAGKSFGQPLWNLSTLTATFSEGARADAHRMASGHPDYSQATTDELYDRKERERTEKNLGWPSCDAVSNAGCSACTTCPLKGPGTRPLQFGKSTAAAVATLASNIVPLGVASTAGPFAAHDPQLPPGFERNVDGYVSMLVHGPGGVSKMVEVAPYPILSGWVQDDPWTLHFKVKLGHGSRTTQISVRVEQANTTDGFAKCMGSQGIALTLDQSKLLRNFVVSWITHLQQIKEAVVTSVPFGWSEPNGKIDGFVFNGQLFYPGGVKGASVPDPGMAQQYTPRGDIQPWRDAVALVNGLGSPERDCFIAAAFAAPLVKFAGQPGLLVSAYSMGSGFGKSTALKTGIAVWGNPAIAKQGLTDTSNSVVNKLGLLRSLPMFWDELKNDNDAARFVQITFQLAEGREKSRMRSDGTLKVAGNWNTLVMSASNESILDHVVRQTRSTTAGVFRVFEYTVPKETAHKSGKSSAQVDQMIARLDGNFGQAGVIYAKFLGENFEQVQKDVENFRHALEVRYRAGNDERYWFCSMACLFLGARYANQLGLTAIDEKKFIKFLEGVLSKMRKELHMQPVDLTNNVSLSSVIQKYMNAVRGRHLILTNRIFVGQGRPPTGLIVVKCDAGKLEGILIQIGLEDRRMRFSSAAFKDWLGQAGYSPHNMMQSLKEKFGAKELVGRTASGTSFAGTSEYIIDFDLNHPELTQLVEF